MASAVTYEADLNLEATELRLGLPGREKEPVNDLSLCLRINKRASLEMLLSSSEESRVNSNSTASDAGNDGREASPPSKAQVVGWPPIRSYRKNNLQVKKSDRESGGMYVKVSMDGAPYLRKIDLKVYQTYAELLNALEEMFMFKIGKYSEREGYNGSEYVPTYEDKDGDWMLIGDVPWEMFISTCKRLRIMKGSEAKGLCCV